MNVVAMLPKFYQQDSTGVWRRSEESNFDYTDGKEVEERLLRLLKSAKDLSLASDELQRMMIDWPSEYHLTPLRANLLSSFDLKRFPKILEIGSGCGAITRQLGEKCPDSEILSLDGSRRRAEITRARCRGLKNVEVCCDSFANFQSQDCFDLITMIGVLEYSPSFFDSVNPVVEAMGHARNMLSEDGVMVIAIENQLGLKYFNGCSEDHSGKIFWGVNDRYLPNTIRTFGKAELQRLIKEAGFDRVEFLYPFPDYKLPQLLLREESLNDSAFRAGIIAGQYPSRDYICDGRKLFDESNAWKVLERNGMLADLSNSFLVFAFNGKGRVEDLTGQWLAKTFSSRRKKKYHIETTFFRSTRGMVARKRPSYNVAEESSDEPPVKHHIDDSPYVGGTLYSERLGEAISVEKPIDGFINYLTPWFDYLSKQIKNSYTSKDEEQKVVPRTLLDCTPANLIWNEQHELCLIDQEWECIQPLEIGFLLFRGIYRELQSHIEILEQSNLFNGKTCFDVIEEIFSHFDMQFDDETFLRYVTQEINFQMFVGCWSETRDEIQHIMESFFRKRREQRRTSGEALQCDLDGVLWELADAGKHIEQLRSDLAQKTECINHYSKSWSWRITAPLRFGGRLVKRIVFPCAK